MKAGDLIEFNPRPAITREQLNAYAKASGDHNPIHLDEKAALAVGLPGVIAHGMISAAFLAERAIEHLESSGVLAQYKLKSFQCRFKNMVHLGDVVSVGGAVKEAGEKTVIDIQARNQRGEVVTLGSTEWVWE
jgi:acyl dehydratase